VYSLHTQRRRRESNVKILLLSDERIRLEGSAGPLTIEADQADASYSPFHMLASALGSCVLSILSSWAEHAKLDTSDLAVEVGWRFVDQPHRVGSIELKIIWPHLPPERRTAAERAAHLCAIHNTLVQSPTISTEIAS
jgi:uncharacterized OsmC-like protein